MYALRMICGLSFVLAQSAMLLISGMSDPAHAAAEVTVDGDKRIEIITEERKLEPGAELMAKTANGRIVVKGWDKPSAKIVIKKEMRTNGGGGFLFWKSKGSPFASEEAAQEYFNGLKVDVTGDEKRLDLRVTYPPRKNGVNLSVSYDLMVPKSCAATLKTSNGAIDVQGISGSVNAETSNGRVALKDILGNVKAHTSNGEIKCEDFNGAFNATTSNGQVMAVRNEPLAQNDEIECHTSNGRIQLSLPGESGFDLEAKTSNGSIKSAFPLPETGDNRPRTYVNAPVNGGGPKVFLRTSNGAINLNAN